MILWITFVLEIDKKPAFFCAWKISYSICQTSPPGEGGCLISTGSTGAL